MKTPEDFTSELAPLFRVAKADFMATHAIVLVDTPKITELIAARDTEIRQACAAEYQRELTMMETRAIDAEKARDVEHRLREAVDREGYTLRTIIGEARKLALKMKSDAWEDGLCHDCDLDELADSLQAVLDRSGARGGSGAASPAPLPDNPPTNTDRSRT